MTVNNAAAFVVAEVPTAGFLGRLVGRVPREALFVQVRNLLATTPFDRVSPDDVAAILTTGKLTVSDASAELIGIFEQAARSCAPTKNSASRTG
jgi:hypothetical protein